MFSFPFRLIRPTRGLLADDFWGNLSPEQFLRVLKSQGFNRINLNIRDFIAMYPEENVRKQALQVWIDDIKSIEIDGYLDITRGKALMVLDQLMELHWTGTVIITSLLYYCTNTVIQHPHLFFLFIIIRECFVDFFIFNSLTFQSLRKTQ